MQISLPFRCLCASSHAPCALDVPCCTHLQQRLETWFPTARGSSRHRLFIFAFTIAPKSSATTHIPTNPGVSSIRAWSPFGRSTKWSARCVPIWNDNSTSSPALSRSSSLWFAEISRALDPTLLTIFYPFMIAPKSSATTHIPTNPGVLSVRAWSPFGRSTKWSARCVPILERQLDVEPSALKEFESMVRRDFKGSGPYPAHYTPLTPSSGPYEQDPDGNRFVRPRYASIPTIDNFDARRSLPSPRPTTTLFV